MKLQNKRKAAMKASSAIKNSTTTTVKRSVILDEDNMSIQDYDEQSGPMVRRRINDNIIWTAMWDGTFKLTVETPLACPQLGYDANGIKREIFFGDAQEIEQVKEFFDK